MGMVTAGESELLQVGNMAYLVNTAHCGLLSLTLSLINRFLVSELYVVHSPKITCHQRQQLCMNKEIKMRLHIQPLTTVKCFQG